MLGLLRVFDCAWKGGLSGYLDRQDLVPFVDAWFDMEFICLWVDGGLAEGWIDGAKGDEKLRDSWGSLA
jgi:hypothetical protein